jgi:hypothetical protein
MKKSGKRRKKESRVGIFWVVGGRLVIDSTPLNEAEAYADFKIHSGDHISMWEKFQQKGIAPRDMEYEDAPRGRVMYNAKTKRFSLLADRCILKDKKLVQEIMTALGLTKTTEIRTDEHYRCFRCSHGE